MPNMKNVLAVIMAGGQGTRLYPLTQTCAKPAVSIAGEYRLIDVPITNCINSGVSRIAVLTQSNHASLLEYLSNTYRFNLRDQWVKVLAGAESANSEGWYRGTADAVRKQLVEIQKSRAEYVLILAGDHVYRMDYGALAQFHMEKAADITVAVQPVTRSEAARFGILKRTPAGRISNFVEKPARLEVQEQFISRDDPERPFLGSMGIYMFSTQALMDLLIGHSDLDDFGGDILPRAINSHRVYGYVFGGYWQDIGTMRSFYETNLALTRPDAPFDFSHPQTPIHTSSLTLPPPTIVNSQLNDVIVAKGCNISNARIEHSVIGVRSQVSNGTTIRDSVIMGTDRYSSDGIGEYCYVEGAILDKNVRLGTGVTIRPFPRGVDMDCGNWFVCDGIVVIPKDAKIAAGAMLAPEAFSFKELIGQRTDDLYIGADPGEASQRWKDSPFHSTLGATG